MGAWGGRAYTRFLAAAQWQSWWSWYEHRLWWYRVPWVSHGYYSLWGGWDIKQHLAGGEEKGLIISSIYCRILMHFSNAKIICLLFYLKYVKMKKPFPAVVCVECTWQRLGYSRELLHQRFVHCRSSQPLDYTLWTIIRAAIMHLDHLYWFSLFLSDNLTRIPLCTSLYVYM